MPRLLIFNLPREADAQAVRALVDGGRCRSPAAPGVADAAVDLHTIPGADRELFAVVHLADDPHHAGELARHLNGCRQLGGLTLPRPLWTWLPVMAWT